MIKLNKILESPDTIKLTGKRKLNWRDNNVYTFGYIDGKFKMIYKGAHYELDKKRRDIGEIGELMGRLWAYGNIMTFWDYPTDKKMLDMVIKDINKYSNKFNFTVDNTWRIEVIVDKETGDIYKEFNRDSYPSDVIFHADPIYTYKIIKISEYR